jgi:signal transduction histidine kinase
VQVVPAYLDSILLNLISNAIKYRSPDREATVEIYGGPENGCTLLAVKDNGLGIDLDRHGKKLFGLYKVFHRNEDARGFGLYLTKSQVEAMGGRIQAESAVGTGSTFKVYFHENS